MEFKDLEIFQMVAKKGTITDAAKALNYVQSNVTSRIQKLEMELHTPLFNRHNRGMKLTPEGKKLIVYAEKILSLTNEMKKVIQSSDEPSGKLERSEEHTSELQSRGHLVCRLLLENQNNSRTGIQN